MCNKVYTVGEAQDREIMQWENVIADAYTQRLKRDRENSMETKVFEISERYLNKTDKLYVLKEVQKMIRYMEYGI